MGASTPALTDAPKTTPAEEKKTVIIDTSSAVGIITIVISSLALFLWHLGAARLSYLKYGSIGWAVLDFIFATIYYPYYALFLAEGTAAPPTGIMMGGGRMVKKMMKLLG
jgi:hypothetical protein